MTEESPQKTDEVVEEAVEEAVEETVAEVAELQKTLAKSTPPASLDEFVDMAKQRLKMEGSILWNRFKRSVPDPLIVAGEEYVERASRIGQAIADGFEGKNVPPPAKDESEPKQ